MSLRHYGVSRKFWTPEPLSYSLIVFRETSNKALNAINEIHLIPFLMSFLAARNKIPLAPVTAAGTCTITILRTDT